MPLDINLNFEQKVRVTATPTTLGGNPAPIDGAVSAELLTGEGSVEAGATPNEIVLVTGAGAGEALFLVKADADLGDGVIEISDTVRLVVGTPLALNLGLAAGEPEPK